MADLIRQPAVAGMFYPADPDELKQVVDGYLQEALARQENLTEVPKAIIAPHAGYVYSGPVAASAYARLIPARDQIRRVVLLGPSHRVPFRGLATTSATHFQTPLGVIPVDRETLERLERAFPQVVRLDEAHAMEHSLEVHLPFLQEVLDSFVLVPLVVGDATPQEVSEVLESLWGDPHTLFVISSDLSHYHDYETARRMDTATSRAIEHLQPEAIGYDQACGRIPVSGLLDLARRHGLHAHTIDLRNSGDTAGPRDQVVGYGAYVVS
ncbi:MAG TPA: AmmeMemoRadiSam system protein B [Gammaproteobacteria bacterium]|nr:AmmeMemoRadiSam system protein B [Gammaproteobacteria bacterium]